MFPREKRLPIGKEKMRPAETFKSPYFSLRISKNTNNHNRFGVIISNSAVKKSTRRHFWKRQFAEAVLQWPNTKQDILIVATPKLDGAEKGTIHKELADIFKKLS